MPNHENERAVSGIHTQTSVFVSPEGERFVYFAMDCQLLDGGNIALVFNPNLAMGMMGGIVAMFKTIMGVEDIPDNQISMDYDTVPDFDIMTPPPPDPNEGPDQPDRYGDR